MERTSLLLLDPSTPKNLSGHLSTNCGSSNSFASMALTTQPAQTPKASSVDQVPLTTSGDNNKACYLLGLPVELRLRIYELAIGHHRPDGRPIAYVPGGPSPEECLKDIFDPREHIFPTLEQLTRPPKVLQYLRCHGCNGRLKPRPVQYEGQPSRCWKCSNSGRGIIYTVSSKVRVEWCR